MVTSKFNKATKLVDIMVDGQVIKSVKFSDVASEVCALRAAIAKTAKYVPRPFTLGRGLEGTVSGPELGG